MRKRRERIELWRAERKKAETAEGVKQIVKNATAAGKNIFFNPACPVSYTKNVFTFS